jgi:multiple sugar transport system ATP-binding protein
MANVRLENVCKIYKGGVRAVTDFSLDVKDGEFVVFVGPSGCGKSTTLRMIAGLEAITSGNVFIGGKYMNDLEPKDRNIAMVFQNYALYPHLSVYENIAYPLRCHRMKREEIDKRVKDSAAVLGITEYLQRKPKELSGGQRQRVALGRAIVRQPQAFLLDEPLSNLDAKLRVQMRAEISKLHEKLRATFIYVTHDQTEAMTMGDRIVVMKDGFIQQVDTPTNLYRHPANVFVATFLGSPQMNVFEGELRKKEAKTFFLSKGEDAFSIPLNPLLEGQLEDEAFPIKAKLGVRPNDVMVSKGKGMAKAKIELVEKLGDQTLVYLRVPGRDDYTISLANGDNDYATGEMVSVSFEEGKLNLFDGETEKSLTEARPLCFLDNADNAYLDQSQVAEVERRLIEKNHSSSMIAIPSSSVSLNRANGSDLSLPLLLDCRKDYGDRSVFFCHESSSGKGISFSADSQKGPKEPGEAFNAFVPLKSIEIVDEKTQSKLTDTEPLSTPISKGELSFRRGGCFMEGDERINHEKAYVVKRMNRLGTTNLIVLEGSKTKEKLTYLVPDSALIYVSMLVLFRKRIHAKKSD